MKCLLMGLRPDLEFRTKGQLAIDICAEAYADGIRFDFACGDEVHGKMHRAARVLRGQRLGVRAAGTVELHPHLGCGHEADLRGSGLGTAEGQAVLRGPLRGQRLQGRALVRLGVGRHRISAPSPAGPPPPQDRGTGLLLLLGAQRAGAHQGPADQGRRPQMAGRRRFRVR